MNTTTRLAAVAVLATLGFEAAAQDHAHHAVPAPPTAPATQPPPAATDSAMPPPAAIDHAAMGHVKAPTQHAPSTVEPAGVDHATMDHSTMDHSKMDQSKVDHSQMDHSKMDGSQMDHSFMGHGSASPSTQPVAPIPPVTDADRLAAMAPVQGHPMHDDTVHSFVLLDRLEAFDADDGTGLAWEARAWLGTDIDRLWLRSEGERIDGRTAHADAELLYGRAITPWWEVVAGVRHDIAPGPDQDFLAVGVQGLAPYKIEVQATAYLGESGQTAARVELEYRTLLTNRWILQPVVEAEFHGKDDLRRGVGAGLTQVEAGVRLRYEITRRFAPYVGVVHERAFGKTATLRREAGEGRAETKVVAGVRFWF